MFENKMSITTSQIDTTTGQLVGITRRRLQVFTRDVLRFKYLRIMLNVIGRLSSVSTTNVQERRRSYAHRLEILTLAKSIFWLCNVKMDITYSKSNIVSSVNNFIPERASSVR